MRSDARGLRAQLERTENTALESTVEVLVVLGLAVTAGLFGGALHCYEHSLCDSAKTCANASSPNSIALMRCSFSNYVTVSGDVIYGGATNKTYTELTRGVCAPGERLHTNSVTGYAECVAWRAWPSAFNEEIAQEGAASFHQKACGNWIDAGPVAPSSVEFWAFHDDEQFQEEVVHATGFLHSSSRLSSTDVGKFETACQVSVEGGNGAVRRSALEAYLFLKAGLQNLTSERRVLEAAGFLSSFHCDAPAQLGVTVDGGVLKATAHSGSSFDDGVLAEALFALGESVDLQNLAERGNTLVNQNRFSSPMATLAQLEQAFEGATGRLDHDNVQLLYGITPEFDGLAYISLQSRFAEASAYLHGVAGLCSFALHGSLTLQTVGGWTAATSRVQQQFQKLQQQRPPAAALGRLHLEKEAWLTEDVTNVSMAQATTTTFSQLQAEPVGNAEQDCRTLARFLFPDRMDGEFFRLVVTKNLYDRMHTMSERIRRAVFEVVVNNSAVRAVFQNVDNVADSVMSTVLKISGAPRGTWAGIERDFADGQLDSLDGPMLMALKTSRSIFNDRISVLFENASPCQAPPVFEALQSNAYVYVELGCAHMLLGVLKPPFADERFDDASLASRAMWVWAHELAHNSLNSYWEPTALESLLSRYSANLRVEGIADLIGALAVIEAGFASASQVCSHISQLWCARTPITWQPGSTATHPGPNERGDLLCKTLVDMAFNV